MFIKTSNGWYYSASNPGWTYRVESGSGSTYEITIRNASTEFGPISTGYATESEAEEALEKVMKSFGYVELT